MFIADFKVLKYFILKHTYSTIYSTFIVNQLKHEFLLFKISN